MRGGERLKKATHFQSSLQVGYVRIWTLAIDEPFILPDLIDVILCIFRRFRVPDESHGWSKSYSGTTIADYLRAMGAFRANKNDDELSEVIKTTKEFWV